MRPEHKANGEKQGEFINNVSKYPKSLAVFKKEGDMSWLTLWLSYFSRIDVNRRASCM